VHFAELTDVEQRVLGCLIEKRWTTPDQYPLSLNALRLACNQSTNRDPVTAYEEGQVRDAAQRLSKYGLARLASGAGSRATKYRHLAEEGLGLDREQLAILSVLLLRGPETPGELKSRSDRMAHLPSLADVERVLAELGDKGYAERLGRRPGQKEDRFRHLLGGDGGSTSADGPIAAGGFDEPVTPVGAREFSPRSYDAPAPAQALAVTPSPPPAQALAPGAPDPAPGAPDPAPAAPDPARAARDNGALEARVAALEAEVADLKTQLADLLE
jgi:hypothetical protein